MRPDVRTTRTPRSGAPRPRPNTRCSFPDPTWLRSCDPTRPVAKFDIHPAGPARCVAGGRRSSPSPRCCRPRRYAHRPGHPIPVKGVNETPGTKLRPAVGADNAAGDLTAAGDSIGRRSDREAVSALNHAVTLRAPRRSSTPAEAVNFAFESSSMRCRSTDYEVPWAGSGRVVTTLRPSPPGAHRRSLSGCGSGSCPSARA